MRAPLPRLGVGLAYQAPLSAIFDAAPCDVDYVEVVPDIFWTDRGADAVPRHLDDDAGLARMRELHAQWPQYGFDRHKGYPSPAHLAALAVHGPCPEHRRSYAPVRDALARLGG